MSDIAPKQPPCEGPQFDENKEYIRVTYDSQGNEIAADPTMHTNTTPGMGGPNYGAEHYADDFKSYGTEVASVAPSKTNVDVNVHAADRGPEN